MKALDFRNYITGDQLVIPNSVADKIAALQLRVKDVLWTFNFPMKERREGEGKYKRRRWFGSYWVGLLCKWSDRGLVTSLTPEWATPTGVFLALDEEYHFTLDACATADNAKCEKFFTREQDALLEEWTGSVFCNPPYGDGIGRWLRKAVRSAEKGATVVCLIPAPTDTEWWHTYCTKGEILFIRGRLKFGDARDSGPFPSAVVVFEPAKPS